MRQLKILYLGWGVILILILAISYNGRGESSNYYGIAETREVVVNAENPVEINRIPVLPGQEVNGGELLVTLSRPELDIKLNNISHQLEEMKIKRQITISEIESQISQLEAQEAAAASEADYKIKQLKARYNINKELTAELKSIKPKDTSSKRIFYNPIDLEIESIKKELELALNLIRIKIDTLKNGLTSPENPLTIQIESLQKELVLLNEEKLKLLIYSQINGVIGSVNFKCGEKVSPFAPILTLHTKSPSYIKGYIHENVYNSVCVGKTVKVVSLTSRNGATTGEVVGVGSRIVEYPVRLRKRPEIQAWGREVQIRISEGNEFLLGEKVMITPVEIRKRSFWAGLKKRISFIKPHPDGDRNLKVQRMHHG